MHEATCTRADRAFDPGHYRRALSRFATGVAVVTTLRDSGAPGGMTINSFSSVSLEPPLVLWSLARTASMFEHFDRSPHFAVNVLGSAQAELSRRFSTRGHDRFAGVAWAAGETGAPLLAGALATFECAVQDRHPAGDHVILVGRVLSYRALEGDPLVFYAGAYREAEPR